MAASYIQRKNRIERQVRKCRLNYDKCGGRGERAAAHFCGRRFAADAPPALTWVFPKFAFDFFLNLDNNELLNGSGELRGIIVFLCGKEFNVISTLVTFCLFFV